MLEMSISMMPASLKVTNFKLFQLITNIQQPVFVINGHITREQLRTVFGYQHTYNSNASGHTAEESPKMGSKSGIIRELFKSHSNNLEAILSEIGQIGLKNQPQASNGIETVTLTSDIGHVLIGGVHINQHLSYHLMRGDASGQSPGITLHEDVAEILLSGACMNIKRHTAGMECLSAAQITVSSLTTMANRMSGIVAAAQGDDTLVDQIFTLKPGMLYCDNAHKCVKFLKDIAKVQRHTVSCNSFWSCASDDAKWARATEFLLAYVETAQMCTFSCGSFWSCAGDDAKWVRATEFLLANVKKASWRTFSCDSFWSCAGDDAKWARATEFLLANVKKASWRTFSCGGFWSCAGDVTRFLDRSTFLIHHVDRLVMHSVAKGCFWAQRDADTTSLAKRVFIALGFGRKANKPAVPPDWLWLNQSKVISLIERIAHESSEADNRISFLSLRTSSSAFQSQLVSVQMLKGYRQMASRFN